MKIVRTLALSLLLLSAACVRPMTGSTPAPGGATNPQMTAAAATIVAELTAIAPSASAPTQPPAATEPPAASPSAPVASATYLPEASLTPTVPPAPSETPAPSPTASAATLAPTAVAPPTAAADDPRQTLGAPDWQDDFADAKGWPLYFDEHAEFSLGRAGLEMRAKNPSNWDSWMLANPTLSDFYLEMEAVPGPCVGNDHYGLVFRSGADAHAYLFGAACNGQYSLRYWNGQSFDRLVDWTGSPALNSGPDAANRLGVWADGPRLRLYANGHLLTEVTTEESSRGGFGVFVGASKTADFTAVVRQIAYWTLPR